MNGVVQEILIRFAGRDMKLPAQARREPGPVLLQIKAQVVALPMFGHRPVNFSGSGIPQRNWKAVRPARAERGGPFTPLLAGSRVAVVSAQQVLDAHFLAHGDSYIPVQIPGARSF